MNLDLSKFTPMPKQHGRVGGTIEKGRILATLRHTKNRPGYITLYVGIEQSIANRDKRYEPCVSSDYNNLIILKPCNTGCHFTSGSRTPFILRATFDRQEGFFPPAMVSMLKQTKGKLVLKVKKRGIFTSFTLTVK